MFIFSFSFNSETFNLIHFLKINSILAKNDFAEVSKNLDRYSFENNFIGPLRGS